MAVEQCDGGHDGDGGWRFWVKDSVLQILLIWSFDRFATGGWHWEGFMAYTPFLECSHIADE